MEPIAQQPSSLLEMTFSVVINICAKCDAKRRLYEWQKFWQMISELPATLKARLIQSLGRLHLLSDENMGYLINNELHELSLNDCLKSDFTVNLIRRHCRNRLRYLDLGARIPNYNMISAQALEPLFTVCYNLEELRLNNCIEVNDIVVDSIVHNCPQLHVLQLSGCLCITDRAVKSIADSCRSLVSLDLSRTPISDDGLCYFASGGVCAKQIRELLVKECSYVTTTSVHQLLRSCPSMTIFRFDGTRATMESFYQIITRPNHIMFNIPFN
ncbi:protein AMN1 homolog [Oppia nitens]|uniref:protein AMN1 homolog n=1 Tax=Oppia nitens TaxID=1686743 RepID=UPI0023DB7ABD|nr:protein AMN1 homolog [Oppia nitens]